MTKVVLTFGLLSGVLSAAMMASTVPFIEAIGFDRGVVVGYTAIVISFLFVYFGVRSYRDNVLGGRLTFGQGFNAGILITLISCLCYVATWLILYYNFIPDFVDNYGAYALEGLRAEGASQAAIDASIKQTEDMRTLLDNPFTNAALAFIEPFPVGLLITLVSAAVLRKQETV